MIKWNMWQITKKKEDNNNNDKQDINLTALSKQMILDEKSNEANTHEVEEKEKEETMEINKIELNDEIFELSFEA